MHRSSNPIDALSSVDYGNMPLLSAPIGRVPSYSNQWNPTPIPSSPNDSLLPPSTSATWNDDTSFFNSDLLPPQNSTGFHSSYGSYQTVALPYSRFLTPSPEPNLLAMLLGLEQGLPVITEEELASIGTLNRENGVNNVEDDELISSSNDGRTGGGEGEGMWRAFGEEDGSSAGSRGRGDKQPLGDPFDIVSSQNRNQRRRQSAPDVNYGYSTTSTATTMSMDLSSDNGGGRGDDNHYVNVDLNRRSTIDVPHHNQRQLATPDDVLRRSTSRDMSFEEQQIQLRAAASLDGFMSANASRSNSNQIPMPTVPAITSEPYNDINLDTYQFQLPNTSTYHEHRPQSQLLHQSNQPQHQHQQQQYQQQQQRYQTRQDSLPHQSQMPYDRQLQSAPNHQYFAQLHQPPKAYFDIPTTQLPSGPAQPAYHRTNPTPSSHELANLVILPSPAQQSSNFSFSRDQEMNVGRDQQNFAANSRPSTAYSQIPIQHDLSPRRLSPPSPHPLLPIDLINSLTIDVKPTVVNKGKRSKRPGKSTRSIDDNNTPLNAVDSSSSSIDRTSNDVATANAVSVTRAVANGSTSAATTNRKNRNPHATQLPGNGTRKGIKAEATEDHAGPICSHCDAITTPLWRRGKEDELLCNACGLYEKLHGKPRPTTYAKQSVGLRGKTASGAASLAAASLVPPSCSNCGATSTPMWRKDAEKKLCCNACSLYYKLHGKLRPSSLSSRQPERNRRATTSAVTAAPASSSSSPTSSASTPLLNSPLAAPQIVLAKSRSTSTSPSSVESLSPHARGSQAPASPLLAVVASLLPSSSSPSSSSGILPPPPHPPTKTPATSLSLSVNLPLTSLPTPSSALSSHHQSMSPKSSLLSPALFNSRASASSNLAWRNSLTPEIRSTSPMYAASERGGSSSTINGNDRTTVGDDPDSSKRRRGGESQQQIELEEEGGGGGGGVKRPRRMDSWERVGGAGALLHLMPSTGPTVADRVLSSSNYGHGNIAIKREF